MPTEFKYWAFISYSHTDKRWGDWLHGALETYKVPNALVRGETQRGEPVPARVFPIFRDREELPTSADLGSVISEALKQARYLIVICSPRAAQSRWVNQEILDYKKLGRANRILALIVAGEPNAADCKPGIPIESECFPEALKHPLRTDDQLDKMRRTEPIAADARPDKDGKTNAKLKLLAGILGVNYDDLKRRDEQRRRRRQRIMISVCTALVLIFATLAGVAVWQWKEAEIQRQEALQTLSESDFLQAQRLITEDKDGDALAYLERSLTNNPDNSAALARLTTLLTYRAWFLPSLTIKLNDVGWSTQLSKDGKLIRTVSGQANTVRVWNAQTGRPSTQPMKPDDFVRYSQYSPDGKRLVTTSNNITRVWNVQTGQPLTGPLQIEDGVWSAWFSPDGKRIFTASATTARVWDAQTGQPLTEEPLEFNIPTGRGVVLSIGPTPSTQFSPDGKRIVTTSVNVVRVWGLETDALPELLKQDSTVSSAQFSPDGTRIVTASLDGTARVWNAQTGQQLAKLKHGGPVYSAQFSPDGTRVVTASQDQTARVWDARTGQPLTEPLKHGGEVLAAQFSPDGKRIVTVSGDGVAYVWDAQTGQQISELKHGSPWVTPSPKFLRSTGQTLSELEHETEILSAQFSPDGKRIVSTSQEGTAPVWSAQTGQILTKSWILGMGVRSAQFSPDGKRIIVTDSPDWTVFVCDAQTGEPKTQIFTGDSITSAQCSPDGKWIVTTLQDGTTRVWDAQTGQPLTELIELGGPVKSAQFSPDGKFIVTASADGTARVWDAQTGQPLTEPMKHDGSVNSAQFSPDGKRIVTVSGNTARVWDIAPVSDQFPNWLLPLTEAISGQFLDEQSVLEPTKLDRVATINQIRRELNQSSDNDGWTEWGRWFLADPATRTISPFSKMTVPQYIEDLIQENTTNSLDEAESLAFGNTNLLHQIFTARQTLEPKTNSLPRP